MMIRRVSLEQAAAQMSREALQVISRDGLSRETLLSIGELLADLAKLAPDPSTTDPRHDQGQYVVIRREADGTFELVMERLREKTTEPEALGYETWQVIAPSHGVVELSGPHRATRRLAPGQSDAFLQGEAAARRALEGPAQVLCLYGIAREHLPPPQRLS